LDVTLQRAIAKKEIDLTVREGTRLLSFVHPEGGDFDVTVTHAG
jgi:hypothetical protein